MVSDALQIEKQKVIVLSRLLTRVRKVLADIDETPIDLLHHLNDLKTTMYETAWQLSQLEPAQTPGQLLLEISED